MNKKKIILVAMLLTLSGCKGAGDDGQPAESAMDSAAEALTISTDNIHFQNKKFGLSIKKPESWYAQNVEEAMQLSARGAQVMSGDDKNMKAALEASLKASLPLFGFFEFPPGTPGKPNPNVGAVAENIAAFPGVKDGCDYLASMKQVIENSQMNMSFGDSCQKEKISGSTFGYVNASIKMGNALISQRYWACKKGDHAIAIVQTFHSEQQDAATTEIIKTIDIQCDS
jgi:hypothetical protein